MTGLDNKVRLGLRFTSNSNPMEQRGKIKPMLTEGRIAAIRDRFRARRKSTMGRSP